MSEKERDWLARIEIPVVKYNVPSDLLTITERSSGFLTRYALAIIRRVPPEAQCGVELLPPMRMRPCQHA
jgi:hypothetical protein